MSVRNEKYEWTGSAVALDEELREKLYPIIEKAIEDGMAIEDVYYVASTYVHEALLHIVRKKKSELMKIQGVYKNHEN